MNAEKPNGNTIKDLLDFIQHLSRVDNKDRSAIVAQLSNAQLTFYYRALHASSISDTQWLPLIEAEVRRRRLLPPS